MRPRALFTPVALAVAVLVLGPGVPGAGECRAGRFHLRTAGGHAL